MALLKDTRNPVLHIINMLTWGDTSADAENVLESPNVAQVQPHSFTSGQGVTAFRLFFRFSVAITLLSLVIMLPATLAAHSLPDSASSIDPFAPYERLMPEQSIATLAEHNCRINYHHILNRQICVIKLETDNFKEIRVTSLGGEITEAVFIVHNLRVGDLVQQWGYPQSMSKMKRGLMLRWSSGRTGFIRKSTFNFHEPLQFVMFRWM